MTDSAFLHIRIPRDQYQRYRLAAALCRTTLTAVVRDYLDRWCASVEEQLPGQVTLDSLSLSDSDAPPVE